MANLHCVLARELYMRPYSLMARPDHSWPKFYCSKPVFVKGLSILRLRMSCKSYVWHRKRLKKYLVNLVEEYVVISENWCLMLCDVELCSFDTFLCRKVVVWCFVMSNCVNLPRCDGEWYTAGFNVDWCGLDIYFLNETRPLLPSTIGTT